MSTDNQLNRIEDRLVRVETKLDTHLDRLSRAEEAIVWLRGHVTIATTILLAILGTLAGWWFSSIS